MLPPVPSDTRKHVQVGSAFRFHDARYRRRRADEAGLRGHHDMLSAKGGAIAERVGEMPDIALERGLRDRPPHRHLAQRSRVLQVRQNRIVHCRATNRDKRIGRELRQIVPVHRRLARQRREADRVSPAEIVDRGRNLKRRERAHPILEKLVKLVFFEGRFDIEMPFGAIHHEAQAILARDHLFKREPPWLAKAVRERGRHINGEGHIMSRQHRIGRRHQILVAAVECQADKPSSRRQRDRAPASLVHRHDIKFPALQRPDRSIEKFGRDFPRFERLKRRRAPRAHALKPQNHAGAAGPASPQPWHAAEIGEFQFQACQETDIGWQRVAPGMRLASPDRGGIVITVDSFCRDRKPSGRDASVVAGEPRRPKSLCKKHRSERRLQAAATRGPDSTAFHGCDGLLSIVTSVKPTALS